MLHHFGHWNGDFSVGSFCIEAAFHDKTARFLASFSSESCTRLATCIATHGASSLTSQQESGGKPVVDSGGFQLGNCERRRATKYLPRVARTTKLTSSVVALQRFQGSMQIFHVFIRRSNLPNLDKLDKESHRLKRRLHED